MHLTGKRKAKVIYVLMDTPEDLLGYYNSAVSYQNVDSKYRIKAFEVEYSQEVIEAIKTRVNEIREYINKLKL
jgi:ppGpp synthetase/RelA/SpoT-type nucleotidyltranferase